MTAHGAPLGVMQFLDGAWASGAGGSELVSHNPAYPTQLVAVGRVAGSREVAAATRGVGQAWSGWSRTPLTQRADVMRAIATGLEASAHELADLVCRELGKPTAESRAEAVRSAEIFRYFAAEATKPVGSVFASPDGSESIETTRRARGVYALITPFNFPLALPAWKLAAALVHGNCVVWKPSEAAAATSQRMLELLLDSGLPPEVIALVQGDRETGTALVGQEDIVGISFTGSTSVGLGLIKQGGSRALPVQAEMGGSNPAIVLADADLSLAAYEIVAGAFSSCGQRCTATRRIVCDESVYDELISRMAAEMASWTMGDPAEPVVRVGPVITDAAKAAIDSALDLSSTQGAQILALAPVGDSASTDGHYVRPAVVAVKDVRSNLWCDEVFGPVAALLRVEGEAAAIEAAGHRSYGLSAAVFTDSLKSARRVSEALDVGVMHVNSATTGAAPHVPFGGVKGSGYGPMEQGEAAQEFYTARRTTYVRSAQ